MQKKISELEYIQKENDDNNSKWAKLYDAGIINERVNIFTIKWNKIIDINKSVHKIYLKRFVLLIYDLKWCMYKYMYSHS